MHMPWSLTSENKRKRSTLSAEMSNTATDHKQCTSQLYHSSSSSCLPCIALCRARNASAKPPARLAFDALLGVPRPLAPDESPDCMLTALSRGAGGGAGLRPAMLGRLAGGAGGAGLVLAAAAAPAPFGIGLGVARGAMGGGGGMGFGAGATATSSR